MMAVLYVRGDQLDQLRESHFRKQSIFKTHVLFIQVESSRHSFCRCFFLVSSWYQQKSKYENENRGPDTEREEEFMFVERNQTKYSVLKNRTLLKVSCASSTSDVHKPRSGHPCYM
jgi:hypothetical protein